jgi:recombination protein RecT
MAYTNNNSNAPLTPRGNKLAPAQGEDKLGVYLGKPDIKAWLNNVLGDSDKAESFVANITSCVSGNPALAECAPSTIVSSALVANSLKLSMSSSLGHCYLVPFEDRKNGRKVATFILGYKGYIQLAIRSGQYKKINVIPIKQGEVTKYDRIRGEVTFNPITSDLVWEQTPTVGYYAYFELINGYKKEIYWSIEKMQYHADKYSKAYSMEKAALLRAGQVPANEMWKYSSYWYSDFDGMACKTMIRQLLSKDGVMSIDMQKAFEVDDDFKKEEFFSGVSGDKLPPRQPNATPTTDNSDKADDADVDGNIDPVTGEITGNDDTDAETQFNFFEGMGE